MEWITPISIIILYFFFWRYRKIAKFSNDPHLQSHAQEVLSFIIKHINNEISDEELELMLTSHLINVGYKKTPHLITIVTKQGEQIIGREMRGYFGILRKLGSMLAKEGI